MESPTVKKVNISFKTWCRCRKRWVPNTTYVLRLLQTVRDQLPRLWLPHRSRGQVLGGFGLHLAWHLLCVCSTSELLVIRTVYIQVECDVSKNENVCLSPLGLLFFSGRPAILLQKRQALVQEARSHRQHLIYAPQPECNALSCVSFIFHISL